MKKTIAKIMAAAMILSAVPAVAMPTLTAEAATITAVSISNVPTSVQTLDGTDTGVRVTATGITNYVQTDIFAASKSDITDTTGGLYASGNLAKYVKSITLNGSGELHLEMMDSTDALKAIAAAVGDKTNTVKINANLVSTIKTVNVNGAAVASFDGSLGEYYVGSADLKTGSKTEYVVTDDANLLNNGDVYATINITAGTAEIVKGDGALKDNDDLRGQLLELNTVTIGGVEYKVSKIGAQALKEAHMKKLEIQNTKTLAKGSLRKCKQMTKVDIEDGQKVRKIHSKAFYDDKNLKTIIIDGRKLKTVGKDAFHGVKKNCTIKIKAKKSKFESDKKMILKNGGNKNLKFVRK